MNYVTGELTSTLDTQPENQANPPPVWGTLTGIRPTKVAEKLLISGKTTQSVIETLSQTYYVSPDRAALCVEAAQTALAFKDSLAPHDVALYVGIPFCPTRCAYCSFVSNSVERSFNLIEPFIETLLQEIEAMAELTRELGLRIISVYIGGGTPTSIPESALESIMTALNQSFDFTSLREYTVEAGRPDTITEKKLEILTRLGATQMSVGQVSATQMGATQMSAGQMGATQMGATQTNATQINAMRICINPQSMSDDVLSAIGRAHSSADVCHAVKLVKQTNAALNMDIIAGLPCDTLEGFRKTLDSVLDFEPENITVHTLSLKKGSRIMLENTAIPSGADVGEMLGYASMRLRDCNYAPYYIYRQKYISGGFENIGWSQPGYEGVYNLCMMEELCTVLALGGGGVTKLVTADGRIERIFNAKYPREYIMMTDKMKDKICSIRQMVQQGVW